MKKRNRYNPLEGLKTMLGQFRDAVVAEPFDEEALQRTAWAYYESHGFPLGDSPQALGVWLEFGTSTTVN
jgi:hypothetical protein